MKRSSVSLAASVAGVAAIGTTVGVILASGGQSDPAPRQPLQVVQVGDPQTAPITTGTPEPPTITATTLPSDAAQPTPTATEAVPMQQQPRPGGSPSQPPGGIVVGEDGVSRPASMPPPPVPPPSEPEPGLSAFGPSPATR